MKEISYCIRDCHHQRETKYRVDAWLPICENWFLLYSLASIRLHQYGMNSVFQMAQRQSFSTGRHPVRVPVPPSPHILHHQYHQLHHPFPSPPPPSPRLCLPVPKFRSLKLIFPSTFLPRLSVICNYMDQYVTNIAVIRSLLRKQSYKTNRIVQQQTPM